jgi:predicted transcriptional regulator
MLGGLEQKIMEALWVSPTPQKPADVVKQLSGDHAYTTITTVLKRMADKKIVKRKLVGNVFYYQPVSDKKDFACSCLDDLFIRLFATYGADVVTSFKKIARREKYSI